MSFLELKSRYVLHGRLHGDEGLHIGSGVPSTKSDAPFLLQGGQPFLPGSSLRGVLRSTVERMVRGIFGPGRCCVLFDQDSAAKDCAAGNEDLRKKLESASAEEFDKRRSELKFCAVCNLFGSTLMASRLKVSDAVAVNASGTNILPVKRDGVGIDRDTETARDKLKYDYEVLERGCDFKFSLHLENGGSGDFALLYMAIKEMEHGIEVGGRRARGLGRVSLAEYYVEYFDCAREYTVLDFLDKGFARVEKQQFEGWLKEAFEEWRKTG
ncbi:MAG TPA: CRISPR-associated RAMP protein Csx7 [Candidatus Saccharimonadales bacterium]|jgi:CRISPR-associated RAMP protein (TIGR02581 family)|nr:CRISPR-associated RAMP protein Csx7 [Candidatus Saccharimonadales bacterium]